MMTEKAMEWVHDTFTMDTIPNCLFTGEAFTEYFDWWTDVEDSSTILIYRYRDDYFVVQRDYYEMADDNYDKIDFHMPTKLTLEEALDLITDFQEYRDSIVAYC